MSAHVQPEKCALCRRLSIECRRDDPERPADRVVCDALHRVVALDRFRSDRRSFLSEDVGLVVVDGRRSAIRLSVYTLALAREWSRNLRDGGRRSAVKLAVAQAVAEEIAYRLSLDLAGVDLDATIGDVCPRCGREKSGDEGAGARDYWCQACVDAARRDAEAENG